VQDRPSEQPPRDPDLARLIEVFYKLPAETRADVTKLFEVLHKLPADVRAAVLRTAGVQ